MLLCGVKESNSNTSLGDVDKCFHESKFSFFIEPEPILS